MNLCKDAQRRSTIRRWLDDAVWYLMTCTRVPRFSPFQKKNPPDWVFTSISFISAALTGLQPSASRYTNYDALLFEVVGNYDDVALSEQALSRLRSRPRASAVGVVREAAPPGQRPEQAERVRDDMKIKKNVIIGIPTMTLRCVRNVGT